MSSPSTRGTLTGLEKAEFLGTSIRTQLSASSPGVGEVFSLLPPRGEGEAPRQSDWGDVQVQNAELIEQAVSETQGASRAYRVAKIRVSEFARSRREGSKNLRTRYRSHQKIFDGACGPRGLVLTGLDVPPETTMLGIREQSSLVLTRYEDPSLPGQLALIPKEEARGPLPDLPVLSQDLREDLETFEAAQDGWIQAKKVRDEAYAVRQEARKRLRRIVTNVARVQEGYYRLAGLDELADRLRLTVRSPRSKKPNTDGADVPPATDTPDVPPTTEA